MAQLLDIPEIEALIVREQGGMVFDHTKLQHINCGRFYRANVPYSHCFWEAWVKVSDTLSAAGYIFADTNGGNHCILFGAQPATATHFTVTGNTHDGTTLTSYNLSETIPYNHDVHLAWGWDGAHLLVWINGVLAYTQAYSPTQRMNPGGNDGTLYIAGSDHSNISAKIYQARGYEGYGRCAENADFAPELFFRPRQHPGSTDVPQFCMSLMQNEGLFIDAGRFEGFPHHGVPEAVQGTTIGTGSAVGTSLSLPVFEPGAITTGTYLPTAPATPSGAVIFDSFSRQDRHWTRPDPLDTAAEFTLGAVEVGGVNWTLPDGSAETNGVGILNGRAFVAYQAADRVVQTSIQNVDVRVDRLPTSYTHTGLIVRYKDGNDFYKIVAYDTSIGVTKMEGGVQTAVSYTPASGWTTLRVTAAGTTFNVYTGTSLEGTFTLQGTFTCTNVAGATKAGITRDHFVKRPHYVDNFLVKAG